MRTLSALLFGVVMLTAGAQTANAHFVWLVFEPAERPTSVKLYFGETAAPDDPDLLDRVATATAVVVPGRRGEPKTLAFEKRYDALVADFPANARPAPVVLRQTYGVVSRGDGPFLLKYYAKAYPSALPGTWDTVADSDLLPLEIVPKLDGSSMIFEVLWKGRPASGATVTVHGPELDAALEGMTDERGLFRAALPGAGLYSVRARRIEMTAGERGGKKYDSIRHYSTLSLNVRPPQLLPVAHNWPSLPRGVTSFGAAIAGRPTLRLRRSLR